MTAAKEQRQQDDRRSLAPKVVVSPEVRERILDRLARGDAVKTIAIGRASTDPGSRKIYQIIAEARAMHDPRVPKGRQRNASPKTPPVPPRKPTRPAGEPLDGWWFAVETITVTTLGEGSVDCKRVPVSVSGVPRRPVRIAPEGAEVVVSVSRSLAEAMAKHPLAGLSGLSDGRLLTEPTAPPPPR